MATKEKALTTILNHHTNKGSKLKVYEANALLAWHKKVKKIWGMSREEKFKA
jgi:hypothetical protein